MSFLKGKGKAVVHVPTCFFGAVDITVRSSSLWRVWKKRICVLFAVMISRQRILFVAIGVEVGHTHHV